MKEVSVVAGHSSIAFTLDCYGHLYERDEEDMRDALDALLEARESREHADWSRTDNIVML